MIYDQSSRDIYIIKEEQKLITKNLEGKVESTLMIIFRSTIVKHKSNNQSFQYKFDGKKHFFFMTSTLRQISWLKTRIHLTGAVTNTWIRFESDKSFIKFEIGTN